MAEILVCKSTFVEFWFGRTTQLPRHSRLSHERKRKSPQNFICAYGVSSDFPTMCGMGSRAVDLGVSFIVFYVSEGLVRRECHFLCSHHLISRVYNLLFTHSLLYYSNKDSYSVAKLPRRVLHLTRLVTNHLRIGKSENAPQMKIRKIIYPYIESYVPEHCRNV